MTVCATTRVASRASHGNRVSVMLTPRHAVVVETQQVVASPRCAAHGANGRPHKEVARALVLQATALRHVRAVAVAAVVVAAAAADLLHGAAAAALPAALAAQLRLAARERRSLMRRHVPVVEAGECCTAAVYGGW